MNMTIFTNMKSIIFFLAPSIRLSTVACRPAARSHRFAQYANSGSIMGRKNTLYIIPTKRNTTSGFCKNSASILTISWSSDYIHVAVWNSTVIRSYSVSPSEGNRTEWLWSLASPEMNEQIIIKYHEAEAKSMDLITRAKSPSFNGDSTNTWASLVNFEPSL